ncbi:MAG: AraC family transcriptional regulator [Holophagales bacterium]|nr:AraC family transcriptional regulator [Holophagales bacterium]
METPGFAPVPVRRRDLLEEIDLGGFRLTESTHSASSVIGRHAHRRATVNILVSGSFEERYPRQRDLCCEATSVLVRPPGADHHDTIGTAGACNLVLELDDSRLESIRRHSMVFEEIQVVREPSALRAVSGIRRELQLRDAATAMALEGLALELCSALVRGRRPAAGRRSRWLRRATELLHDRFRDPDLRFRGLAEEVGVHPVSFTRAFRAAHGSSPGEYLRRLRVEWAEERIRTGDAPLAEIAADAGFADQSHLTRVFRAELGITPGAWRRRHR